MENDIGDAAGDTIFVDLLKASREALSHLNAKSLEELADRLEKMCGGDFSTAPSLSDPFRLSSCQTFALKKECRLLGNLLVVTHQNLEILQRSRARLTGETT